MLVALWELRGKRRMECVIDSLRKGILRAGDSIHHSTTDSFSAPIGDAAVVWGLHPDSIKITEAYRKQNKPVVIIDLGYWGRPGESFEGYYKFSVNYHHPVTFTATAECAKDRFSRFNINVAEKSNGDAILLAGMGVKTAEFLGIEFEYWEKSMLAKFNGEHILYRAKPSSSRFSKFFEGVERSEGSLQDDLARAKLVVTYHSNVSIDGLIAGVPCLCEDGPAKIFSGKPLPTREERLQFLYNLAYCQWNLTEMQSGEAWRFIRSNQLYDNTSLHRV